MLAVMESAGSRRHVADGITHGLIMLGEVHLSRNQHARLRISLAESLMNQQAWRSTSLTPSACSLAASAWHIDHGVSMLAVIESAGSPSRNPHARCHGIGIFREAYRSRNRSRNQHAWISISRRRNQHDRRGTSVTESACSLAESTCSLLMESVCSLTNISRLQEHIDHGINSRGSSETTIKICSASGG